MIAETVRAGHAGDDVHRGNARLYRVGTRRRARGERGARALLQRPVLRHVPNIAARPRQHAARMAQSVALVQVFHRFVVVSI